MDNYPVVVDEMKTLQHMVNGRSIARYGDGEFKLCRFADCVSQEKNTLLLGELRALLIQPTKAMIGIPNITQSATPKLKFWQNYTRPAITSLLSPDKEYYSSFITRPDSAPWIDTPAYWQLFRKLWEGHKVTLVRGTDRSLMPKDLKGAAEVVDLIVPAKNAYDCVDEIEEKITTNIVLLCCGATATVLAERLAKKGKHALDVGHIGMFINNQGIYKMTLQHLISDEYRAQNIQLHSSEKGFGGDGHKSAAFIYNFAREIGATNILDYGCGVGTLKTRLREFGFDTFIGEYDPAISGKDILPKPADLVVCTDVLEHVEPEKIEEVIAHIYGLTVKGCYLNIAMRPAKRILPDGRNAHLIVEGENFWESLVLKHNWKLVKRIANHSKGAPHSLQLWFTK